MNNIQIITTSDGSHSLLNTELKETYHSVHGALQESIHVFIKNGFDFFCERSHSSPIKILEVGFGTGLNTLLTLEKASEVKRDVHYTTIEPFPLPENIWSKLNYGSESSTNYFAKLHHADWSADVSITPYFRLLKIKDSIQQIDLSPLFFDVVYFDAFAPNKQPEMWDILALQKVADAMKPQGILVTYCAKGQVKRDLKKTGLAVETLQGPPGKKEMTRATKLSAGIS